MTRLLVIVAVFLLSSCASFKPPEALDALPQLMYQAPLPQWPVSLSDRGISLDLKIYVDSLGSVQDAVFMTPTGFREWEAQALQQVRRWRFSPAMIDGRAVPLWIRQTVRVRFEQPVFLTIAELVCADLALADSIYALLESGEPFDSLAKHFSTAASREQGGSLGRVDLRTFPDRIRRELAKLREGELTAPLALGRAYVIYRRLPEDAQRKAK